MPTRNWSGRELPQIAVFFRGNYAIGRVRRHLVARSMICDFHHALVERKTVIACRRNIGAEKGKPFREKKFGLIRLEMKHRMSRCAKKFSRERQQIGSPRANCDNYRVTANSMSILQDNAFDAVVIFVQSRKFSVA